MKREVHPVAYDYMLNNGEGWTTDELEELSEAQIVGTYEFYEYTQGTRKMEMTHCVVNESGDLVDMIDYEGYVGESYQEAMIREAHERGSGDGRI